MRAALYDHYGSPDVLYDGLVEVPSIRPGQLLIKVHAATVNGGELILRSGALPSWFMKGPFPRQLGLDFVGEIAEIGSAGTGFEVGEAVWGALDEKPDETGQALRSLAQYLVVEPGQISYAPRDLSPVEAATLPLGGMTALIALRRVAGLAPGERLLVRGAAGGVGSAVVQVGKAFGAHVTALAGSSTLDFVREIGADEVYDYRVTGPENLGRFDVIVDTVGTELRRYRRLLAPKGRMVAARFDTNHIVTSLATIVGSSIHGKRRIRFFRGKPAHELFAELTQMADAGTLRPTVDSVFPLSETANAHHRLEGAASAARSSSLSTDGARMHIGLDNEPNRAQ
ncbi:NAD(P)-dependent alcohol dehydrogenase [Okibacterium endophyticum]